MVTVFVIFALLIKADVKFNSPFGKGIISLTSNSHETYSRNVACFGHYLYLVMISKPRSPAAFSILIFPHVCALLLLRWLISTFWIAQCPVLIAFYCPSFQFWRSHLELIIISTTHHSQHPCLHLHDVCLIHLFLTQ